MRNLFLIFKNGIRRSRVLIPGVLLMTALLTICFFGGRGTGYAYAVTKVNIGVINEDGSLLADDMLQFMEEKLYFQVVEADEGLSYEEQFDYLTDRLLNCKVSAILEIPKGMQEEMLAGKTPELLLTILDDYANEAYVKSYLSSYMERTQLLVQASGGDMEKLSELLTEASEEERKISLKEGEIQNLKKLQDEGGIAMMVGFFSFVGFGYPMFLGMLIMEDKKNGTFKRIQVSSVKPAAYIGGMALGNLAISVFIVLGLLLMLGIYGVECNVPFWLLGLLMCIYLLFCTGFNLMAAFLVKGSFTYTTIGIAYVAISNILGGAYFPLGDNVLAQFSVLTPQYFIMNTVRGIADDVAYGYHSDIFILLLMTVLVYLIAAVVFTRRENA